MPAYSPARRIMIEHQIDPVEFAELVTIKPAKLSRYITGERSLDDGAHAAIIMKYGDPGIVLSATIKDARRAYLNTHPIDSSSETRQRKAASPPKAKPAASTRRSSKRAWRYKPAEPDADWDGVLYEWDEWKRLFPEYLNKTGVDETGRIWGSFPTEPDYLGE